MSILKRLSVFIFFCVPIYSLANEGESHDLELSLTQFFQRYLNIYNQHLSVSTPSSSIGEALRPFTTDVLVMAPPNHPPNTVENVEQLERRFGRFVKRLKSEGVVRLEWQQIQVNALTSSKALANNIGLGFDKEGNKVFETISLYIVNRIDDNWKISVFSPYSLSHRVDIRSPGET